MTTQIMNKHKTGLSFPERFNPFIIESLKNSKRKKFKELHVSYFFHDRIIIPDLFCVLIQTNGTKSE